MDIITNMQYSKYISNYEIATKLMYMINDIYSSTNYTSDQKLMKAKLDGIITDDEYDIIKLTY